MPRRQLINWPYPFNPKAALVVGALVTFAAAVYAANVTGALAPDSALDPGAPSTHADELIEAHSGIDPRADVLVLVDTRRDRAARLGVVASRLRRNSEVAAIETARSNPALRSANPDRALLVALLRSSSDTQHRHAAKSMIADLGSLPYVRLGGKPIANEEVDQAIQHDLGTAEAVALPILLLLSFVFFRGLVAALLPLVVGVVAILVTLALLRLLTGLVPISVFAVNVVTGLGLGLALDYALFIVSRFREELSRGRPPPEAIRWTLRTAGRTVLFSALTIVTALASLLVFPHRFLYSLGIGGALVTAVAAIVALTLLPAVLVLLGPRVNALSPRRLRRAAEREAESGDGRWGALASWAMRWRFPIAIAAVALLLAPAAVLLHLRLTTAEADARSLPVSAEARQVEDEARRDFPGAASASSIRVVIEDRSHSSVAALGRRLAGLPDVGAVAPAHWLDRSVAVIELRTASADLSSASQSLVRRIRAIAGPGALVGGTAASFVDLESSLAELLPLALAIAMVGTVALVFLFTGSLLLPIKAVLLNLLTFAATLGILAVLFGELDVTLPPLLFATVFGLSTDYGVFVLGRIKEAHEAGEGNEVAIVTGLARSGRIVTAAAVMFAVATGSFVISEIAQTRQVGLALAIAVLIDATVIRAMLVPATMSLLGDWNWWAPRGLSRWRTQLLAWREEG